MSKGPNIPVMRMKLLKINPVCHYCSRMLDKKTATIDHRIPKCFGGKSDTQNCVLSCRDCNSAKGAMAEGDFKLTRR